MDEDSSEVDEVIDKLSGPGWLVNHNSTPIYPSVRSSRVLGLSGDVKQPSASRGTDNTDHV